MFDCDIKHLIGEVKRHPVLWDTTHPDYNHRQPKALAWEEVTVNLFVDSLNWSNYEKFGKVKDVQKKWENIKDLYTKEMKYEKRVEEGQAQPRKRKYPYLNLLDFLMPPKKNKRSNEPSKEQEQNGQENKIHENHLSSPALRENSCGGEIAQTETQQCHDLDEDKHSQEDTPEHDLSRQEQPSDQLTEDPPDTITLTQEQNGDKMFLLSLLPYFTKLTEEHKLQARISIEKVLQDLIYKNTAAD
ncbi:uncharacterized protein LOC124357698 isoform X1 [Homalodisca vitripennis]|uniref:uncharacterized protein LOC124357698 isoform X1 n=1 Tax=Homalodisca vitripennis TaxID=197043 RepID=UPI001EEC5EA8|nr:uncharacterized protein LOC124357698 isoform X1 [Homalodisca vitripennis]